MKTYHFLGLAPCCERWSENRDKNVPIKLVGTIMGLREQLEWPAEHFLVGFLTSQYIADSGLSVTKELIRLIKSSKYYRLIDVIFLDTLTLMSREPIFMQELTDSLDIPVIVLFQNGKPDFDRLRVKMHEKLLGTPEEIDQLFQAEVYLHKNTDLWFQFFTPTEKSNKWSLDQMKGFITLSSSESKRPEALRVSKILMKSLISDIDIEE